MKTILLLVLVALIMDADWLTDFPKAREIAGAEHKMILLNFSGSDWCGPCIKMKKEIFETEVFKAFAGENLVLVRADFPRLKRNLLEEKIKVQNESLAGTYNPMGKFPYTVLLDVDGRVIHEWDGFAKQSPQEFVSEIKTFSSK